MRRPAPRLTVELPDEWEDRSILTYVGGEQAGFRATLMIARRPAAGVTLEAFVAEQEQSLARQLLRVQQHEKRALHIGDRPAVLLDFSFHSKEAGNLRQLLAFVATERELITASVTAAAAPFEAQRALYAQMLQSLAIEA